MSARDLPPDFRPSKLEQAQARGRQVLLMTALIPRLDVLIEEAAIARVSAPGLLEMREWACHNLEEVAAASYEAGQIAADPLKDACAGSVVAARFGTPGQYAAARKAEAAARAGA